MFKLNENYEVNRSNIKCDFKKFSPSEISTKNTANSQIYIKIPREVSIISLLIIYLDLNFDVVQDATNKRYVESNDIRLINLGPLALFKKL